MCRVQTLWEKAVEFHGHECPGLAMGYKAYEAAIKKLGIRFSEDEELFNFSKPSFELPEKARLFTTVICENCGEGAPEHKLRINDGKKVCLDCFKDYARGW